MVITKAMITKAITCFLGELLKNVHSTSFSVHCSTVLITVEYPPTRKQHVFENFVNKTMAYSSSE